MSLLFCTVQNWLDLPNSIYIIHHSPLTDRRAFISQELLSANLPLSQAHWVTQLLPTDPPDSATDTNTALLDSLFANRSIYYSDTSRYVEFYRATDPHWRWPDQSEPFQVDLPAARFMALGLKHRIAFLRMLEAGAQHALILEDDVHFFNPAPGALQTSTTNQFRDRLLEYWSQLPCDYDMFFLGSMYERSAKFHNVVVGEQRVYRRRSTRTTDGYVVSAKGARRILEVLLPLTMAIDW